MIEELEPTEPIKGNAYKKGGSLPTHQFEAIKKFKTSKVLQELLGHEFSRALIAIKETEYKAYNAVISSWERENLLLNV
jgi:glutamine synthetase